MKKFNFNGKVDGQIDEFKEFVKNLNEINLVKITICAGKEITISTLREELEKISEVLGEDTKFEFEMQADEKLNDNESKITIDFE